MDTRVCPGCMGSGEMMYPIGVGTGEYELASCSWCKGNGQVPLDVAFIRRGTKTGKDPKKAAEEAIAKFFGKNNGKAR